MKSIRLIACLFFCIPLLTSCTRTIILQVFNNTGENIAVTSYELHHKEKRYSVDKAESQRVQVSNHLTITQGRNMWDYDVKSVPKTKTFMTSEHFGALVVKLQVEQNGVIYLLPPTAEAVMTNFPPQPAGYPLRPR